MPILPARVEAAGKDIKKFKTGDEVFGDIAGCGFGGFAEYVAVPERFLARKPARVSFEDAAALPMAAVTALQGLRDEGNIQPGQKVLIYGASGGVGTYAIQLAKYLWCGSNRCMQHKEHRACKVARGGSHHRLFKRGHIQQQQAF